MIKITKEKGERVFQGDVLKEVECIENHIEVEGIIEITKIVFPHVVVLTQDCDLAQDTSMRVEEDNRQLLSVLVAPIYNAEHVFAGEHLEGLGYKTNTINKRRTAGQDLMRNNCPRYHYIEFPDDVDIVPSIIDFKQYFSVPVVYVEKIKSKKFACKIEQPYRENISHRFAYFLSRIGLPI